MGDLNYDEVTNSVYPSSDPMFHWDSHFPLRFSRMHIASPEIGLLSPGFSRKPRRPKDRNRYKTQPITFDEIVEVDEDNGFTASDAFSILAPKEELTRHKAVHAPFLQYHSLDSTTDKHPIQASLHGSDKENTPTSSALLLRTESETKPEMKIETDSDFRREFPGISRRKRSMRNLRSRNRNSVQEVPEGEDSNAV